MLSTAGAWHSLPQICSCLSVARCQDVCLGILFMSCWCLVVTRHSPLFCCVCVARVPGLSPGILFMSCWYLMVPRVVGHAPRHPKCMPPCGVLPECVPMMPSQELGWLAVATLVYVLCRGPTRAGPPSPCFASFEGVAPAVLPILLFHNRWKPMLACPMQPWTVKIECVSKGCPH